MNERHNLARGSNEWEETYGGLGSAASLQQVQLPLASLDPWLDPDGKPQIFKPYTKRRLNALAENIREQGVIEPISVRPLQNGRFQILSGHNRVEASKLAGLTCIPAIIRVLNDAEAEDMVRDSNLLHRPDTLPSERAYAYAQVMRKISHRGKRTDLTLDNGCPKLTDASHSHKVIADMYSVSATSVKQYLRLLQLHPSLLAMVDNEAQSNEDRDDSIPCLTFVAGYELSFLPDAAQEQLLSVMETLGKVPSPAQAKQLHKKTSESFLTKNTILDILQPGKTPKPDKAAAIKLPGIRISSFFPTNTSPEKMEAEIYEALLAYRKANTPPAST